VNVLILAESEHFTVFNEYEEVYLDFKSRNRQIYIGDFYGGPHAARISNNERFCVMIGCGIIIYYFQEPFEEYAYNATTHQWKELFREKDQECWVNSVEIIDESHILFENDELEKYQYNLESGELTKCT
jgi:hypothetical protein